MAINVGQLIGLAATGYLGWSAFEDYRLARFADAQKQAVEREPIPADTAAIKTSDVRLNHYWFEQAARDRNAAWNGIAAAGLGTLLALNWNNLDRQVIGK